MARALEKWAVAALLTPADVRLFCEQVATPLGRGAVRDRTIEAKFSLSAQAGGGLGSTASIGDDEDVRSLLLDFRSSSHRARTGAARATLAEAGHEALIKPI